MILSPDPPLRAPPRNWWGLGATLDLPRSPVTSRYLVAVQDSPRLREAAGDEISGRDRAIKDKVAGPLGFGSKVWRYKYRVGLSIANEITEFDAVYKDTKTM